MPVGLGVVLRYYSLFLCTTFVSDPTVVVTLFDYRWMGWGPWGEALAKKAPPGQTLFSRFLFLGATFLVSKIFSGSGFLRNQKFF